MDTTIITPDGRFAVRVQGAEPDVIATLRRAIADGKNVEASVEDLREYAGPDVEVSAYALDAPPEAGEIDA